MGRGIMMEACMSPESSTRTNDPVVEAPDSEVLSY